MNSGRFISFETRIEITCFEQDIYSFLQEEQHFKKQKFDLKYMLCTLNTLDNKSKKNIFLYHIKISLRSFSKIDLKNIFMIP